MAEYGRFLKEWQNMAEFCRWGKIGQKSAGVAEYGRSLQVWQKTAKYSRKQKNKKESNSLNKPTGHKAANDNASNNVHIYITSPVGRWPTPYLNN